MYCRNYMNIGSHGFSDWLQSVFEDANRESGRALIKNINTLLTFQKEFFNAKIKTF